MVFSRAGDTRAHPWTFALFAFTTFTDKRKIKTIFTQNRRQKNALSFHFSPSLGTVSKMSHISTKTWEILTKTSELFEKTWEKFSKMSELFLKHSEILQTQPGHFFHSAPKIERKNPFPLKLPSFHLLFSIASTENPSVILPPNYLISVLDFPFSTSIPLTSAKNHA